MDCEIDLPSPTSEDSPASHAAFDHAVPAASHDGAADTAWPVVEMSSRSAGIVCLRQTIEELIQRYDDCLAEAPASLATLVFARHRQDLAGISESIAEKIAVTDISFKSVTRSPHATSSQAGSLAWQNAETFIDWLGGMLVLHRRIAKLTGHNGCSKPVAAGGLGWAALELTAEFANRLGTAMQLHVWSLNQLIADTRARSDAFPFASEARLRDPEAAENNGAMSQSSNEGQQADAKKSAGKGGLSAWQLRRIDLLVEAEPGKQISVPRLAETVGLSVSHFTRAFKVSMGQPPAHWLLSKRLDLAKALLVDSDASLAQIAETCGFAEQSHFSKRFRQVAGMTPGDWRRRHK